MRSLCERANNRAPRQIDLESVVCKPFGIAEKMLRGLHESRAARDLAAQRRFYTHVSPRLMRDAAKRQPCFLDLVAAKLERRGDRNQGKRIRQPVADFQVGIMLAETFGRKLDRGDDLVRAQICVALWRFPGRR